MYFSFKKKFKAAYIITHSSDYHKNGTEKEALINLKKIIKIFF